MQGTRSSPHEQLAHTQLAWQIDAPQATIRGLDVVDAFVLIRAQRSEHHL